ncbi:MAG: hypothetical protein L6V81_03270 [Clostridium sp.]|nr:MAG: hypothetical protein L6V81_03270 [Clostridium sp.]
MLVGLNDYGIVNNDNSFIYTRDLSTCIVIIIHRKYDAVLMHIEAYNGYMDLDRFKHLFNENVMFADIFKSFYTSESDVNRVIELLNKYNISYDINDVFVNYSNSTSVGYDYVKKINIICFYDTKIY